MKRRRGAGRAFRAAPFAMKAFMDKDFNAEMLHVYEQKSSSRDELVRRARKEIKALAQEMRTSLGNHPELEPLVITLVNQLEMVKGKKTYNYIPKAIKKTVDEIVDQLEQPPAVVSAEGVSLHQECSHPKGREHPHEQSYF